MPSNRKLLLFWCDSSALLYEISQATNILESEGTKLELGHAKILIIRARNIDTGTSIRSIRKTINI
jgi:hypothetical protein